MKKIVGLIICVTLFATGLFVGLFAFDGPRSAEGSVPIQIVDPEGWQVTNFTSIRLDSRWRDPFLVDDCGKISSNPRVGETALVFVRTETEDVVLEYPNRGSIITACPGFTAYFPPASSGTLPSESDR